MKRGGGWPGGVVAVAAVLQLGLVSPLILPPTPVFLPRSEVGRPPRCREGYNYFRDFIKCDASIGSYCFQYGKSSCVGPPNWACVDALNRRAKVVTRMKQDPVFKRVGSGNTRCCGGNFQSPVNIPASAARCIPRLPLPRYLNQSLEVVGIFRNKGIFPEFKMEADNYDIPMLLTGVPYACAIPGSSLYVLTNIQIHTGRAGKPGSEHLVQGRAYDGELTEGKRNRELNKLLSVGNLNAIRDSDKTCPFGALCDLTGDTLQDGELRQLFGDGDFCDPPGDGMGAARAVYIQAKRPPGDYREGGNGEFVILAGSNSYRLSDLDSTATAFGTTKRSGKPGRRVRCFCRRRSYQELFLWYARQGEEFQCRMVHYTGMPSVDAYGNIMQNTNRVPCNKQGDGDACSGGLKGLRLRPGMMLPSDMSYYHYFGSLTTPPCSEVVNWVVMKKPLRVTQEQLMAIRQLESSREDSPIGNFGNVRPPLPLNGRVVSTNTC